MAEEENCSVSSYSESGEEGEEVEECEEEEMVIGVPLGASSLSTIAMDDLAFVAQIVDQTKNSYYAQPPAGDLAEDLHSIPQNVFPDQMGENEEEDDDCFDSETEEILCGGEGRDALADDEEMIAVGPLRTAHEIVEIPSEKIAEEVTAVEIPTNEDIVLIGEIVSQITTEHTVVIKSVKTTAPLDEGSLLCLENRHPIGRVNEIFGPLNQPFYVVKGLATVSLALGRGEEKAQQVVGDGEGDEEGEVTVAMPETVVPVIAPGTKIYSPIGMTSFVTPLSLSAVFKNSGRPTDASNLYDEEPGENEMPEFSDDEQEQEWKRQQREKKKGGSGGGNGEKKRKPRERSHPAQSSPHSASQPNRPAMHRPPPVAAPPPAPHVPAYPQQGYAFYPTAFFPHQQQQQAPQQVHYPPPQHQGQGQQYYYPYPNTQQPPLHQYVYSSSFPQQSFQFPAPPPPAPHSAPAPQMSFVSQYPPRPQLPLPHPWMGYPQHPFPQTHQPRPPPGPPPPGPSSG